MNPPRARRTVLFALTLAAAVGLWHRAAAADAPAEPPTTAPTTAAAARVAYDVDFNATDPGPQWSTDATADTPGDPTGDAPRRFLGPLGERPVTLTVPHLPPHAFVRVRFDLITFERWNGDSQYFGRDLWDCRVVGGQPLIHTTFSNCGFFSNNTEQSYPDQYPWYPIHPAWTGAAAHQTLGWQTSQGPDSWGDDSTYAIDVTFPHTGDELKLQFASQIKRHEKKQYGLLTFHVETVAGPAAMADEQMAATWADLAGDDPVKANAALWALAATGDAATAYAAAHLPAHADPAPVNVDMAALFTAGSFQYQTPASRQLARATHLLEVIDTPAARAQLDKIGYFGTPQGGPPDQYTGR